MIYNMDLVKRNGQMVHIMRDNMLKDRSVVKANMFGVIIVIMKVNGKIIKYMVKECIIGLMVEDILVNGRMV